MAPETFGWLLLGQHSARYTNPGVSRCFNTARNRFIIFFGWTLCFSALNLAREACEKQWIICPTIDDTSPTLKEEAKIETRNDDSLKNSECGSEDMKVMDGRHRGGERTCECDRRPMIGLGRGTGNFTRQSMRWATRILLQQQNIEPAQEGPGRVPFFFSFFYMYVKAVASRPILMRCERRSKMCCQH